MNGQTMQAFRRCVLVLLVTLGIQPLAFGQLTWVVKGHIASSTRIFPSVGGRYVTLNVDWDPASQCRSTIGLIVTEGSALGTYKSSKKSSENMVATINGVAYSDSTLIAGYTGGVEAMMYAPEQLLAAMRSASEIEVQIFAKSARFSFPLTGAANAIAQAKANCR